MATIRPDDLPAAGSVANTDAIVIDNGATVSKATPVQVVDAATPLASQAEAEAGTDNVNRMSPLRVKQAMDANMATTDALAATTGAGKVGASDGNTVQQNLDHGGRFTPLGADPRETQDRLIDEVNVMDYIPAELRGDIRAGTSTTDVSSYVLDAIAEAKNHVSPTLVIPRGTYDTADTTIMFDLPDQSTIVWYGSFVSSASGAQAVILGSTARRTNHLTIIGGVDVARSTVDMAADGTTSESVGVEVLDINWPEVTVKRVTGFTYGLRCNGVLGGLQQGRFSIGRLSDNKVNLHLTASGAGWCDENSFYSGDFNHSSGYPNFTGTVNLQIDHVSSNILNNNRFYGPSFQDNNAASVAAIINGETNSVYHPRLENPANQYGYTIHLTSNAHKCRIEGDGFGLLRSNILNEGSNSYIETGDYVLISKATASDDGTGKAVLTLQSSSSSAAKLVSLRNSVGAEAGYLDASGVAKLARGYFNTGIRWSTTDGTFTDRGLFTGSGSPAGVITANPGSIYFNTAGGVGLGAYIKLSGGSNTGWYAIQTAYGVATVSRPSASGMPTGTSIFDTTLGKPIWSTGSAWVDATGATV